MSIWKITSSSSNATESLGETIGKSLKGGEIIELSSDLGGGKTTFVKGLARGLGVHGGVSSPTFVVSKIYSGTELELHHYDFYRLGELGIMSEEIQEVIENTNNVTAVEWGEKAHTLFPPGRLIQIEIKLSDDENVRDIVLTLPTRMDGLMSASGATQ